MLEILHQSIWRDEAFSLLLSEKGLLQIISLAAQDSSPPLYYLILHFWLLGFGNAPEVGRLLSLIFHLLLLPVASLTIWELTRSRRWSILTAFLVLLNPFLLQYSFEIRNYSLFTVLTLTSFYFFLRKRSLLFSIFLTLTLLTHNYALFTLISFIVAWALGEDKWGNCRAKILLFLKNFLLPLSALATWGPIVLIQYQKVSQGFWLNKFRATDLLDLLNQLGGGNLDYPQRIFLLIFTGTFALLLTTLWLTKKVSLPLKEARLFLTVILLPPVIVFIISSIKTPIYHPRYLINLVPLLIIFLLFIAFHLSQSSRWRKRLASALLIAYLVSSILAAGGVLSQETKPPIKEAVLKIVTEIKPGEIVMTESNLNFLEAKYYLKQIGPGIPIYVYSPDGRVVFYVGGVLFEKKEILTQIPLTETVWQIRPDGTLQKLVKGRPK